MKKLICFSIFILAAVASAQTNRFPPINLYTGDPTGASCAIPNSLVQSTTTGGIYGCVSGAYAPLPPDSAKLPLSGGTITGNLNVTGTVAAGTVHTKGVPTYDVISYGADPTGSSDSSSAFSQAWVAAKASGGIILLPPGVYEGYLDVSGCTAPTSPVIIEGWGATWIPAPAPAQSALLYADDSSCSGAYNGTALKVIGVTMCGESLTLCRSGSISSPTLNYLLYMKGTEIETEKTSFIGAKVAAVYGYYAQYYRSTDDTFSAGNYSATTTGAYFTGNTASYASNELAFIRPRFNTNSIGAHILGGFSPTFIKPEVQNNFVYGIDLDQDGSGLFVTGAAIDNIYSEINTGPAIYLSGANGTTIKGGVFLDNSTNWILSVSTYNLSVIGVKVYGSSTAVLNHPSGNSDTATLTWIGNSQAPTVTGLTHSGITELNISTDNGATTLQPAGNLTLSAPTSGATATLSANGNTTISSTSNSVIVSGQGVQVRNTNSNGSINLYPNNSTNPLLIYCSESNCATELASTVYLTLPPSGAWTSSGNIASQVAAITTVPKGETSSQVAGQVACIKSVGPPVTIGTCSGTVNATTGACGTCN